MTVQSEFFGAASGAHEIMLDLPEGLRYCPELIGRADEDFLLSRVRKLPLRDFEFHGYMGKRRVISFGWRYDFSGRRLQKADDMPDYLLPLQEKAAAFAKVEPDEFEHVLITEYDVGAGIG